MVSVGVEGCDESVAVAVAVPRVRFTVCGTLYFVEPKSTMNTVSPSGRKSGFPELMAEFPTVPCHAVVREIERAAGFALTIACVKT